MEFSASHSSKAKPSQAWVEALHSGSRALHDALERLFAPNLVEVSAIESWSETSVAPLQGATSELTANHFGAAFQVEGPLRARLMLFAEADDCIRISAALRCHEYQPGRPLNEADREAFSELANIVASSFLNGLARELRLRLLPSIPSRQEAPLNDVLDGLRSTHAWISGAHFTIALPSGDAKGVFIAAPEHGTLGA